MVDEGDGLVSARGIPEPFESTDDGTTGVRWAYVLGAVALTVAGIVISAAFAVGARRQLVSIGQLSASGASPATIRSSLVLQGTFTGIVGAVAGFVLAAVDRKSVVRGKSVSGGLDLGGRRSITKK